VILAGNYEKKLVLRKGDYFENIAVHINRLSEQSKKAT